MRRAGERAFARGCRDLGAAGCEVAWHGRGGASLRDFPRQLQAQLRFSPSPSVLIIHAGSNDLGRYSAKDCRQAVDEALNTARSLLPQCYISFSSILPRLYYYGHGRHVTSQVAINNVRKGVNKYARRRVRRMHSGSFIGHNFNVQEHWYFHRDGVHLSDEGCDLLMENFASAVRFALNL